MYIVKAELDTYFSFNLKPTNIFGSEGFVRLNAERADELLPFVGYRSDTDKEPVAGIVLGRKGVVLCAPWSAPYTALNVSEDIREDDVSDFGLCLRNLLVDEKIRLVNTPEAYHGLESVFFKSFVRPGDTIIEDTSFHVSLCDADVAKNWDRNRRRNLKVALEAGLYLERTDDIDRCYNIIASHHASRGYNMAMTLSMVKDTAKVLPVNFWIVKKGEVDMSAAFCYRVREDIVQVINSGDTAEGRSVFAMTYMAMALINHYKQELVICHNLHNAILDYGPTSVDGVQNEGLARYKAAFGCIMSPKYQLRT